MSIHISDLVIAELKKNNDRAISDLSRELKISVRKIRTGLFYAVQMGNVVRYAKSVGLDGYEFRYVLKNGVYHSKLKGVWAIL